MTRNPGAVYCLPSLDEWYKAAYYNPSSGTYWLYPTQSNTPPSNVLSSTGTNNANYGYTNGLTPVGSFAGSPGPYGTFDQGGELFQWSDTILPDIGWGPGYAVREQLLHEQSVRNWNPRPTRFVPWTPDQEI